VDPEVRAYHHFGQQSEFLIDPRTDKIGVVFPGRFESRDEDFAYVAYEIGLDVALEQKNQTDYGLQITRPSPRAPELSSRISMPTLFAIWTMIDQL
jgi:hypothetical protein